MVIVSMSTIGSALPIAIHVPEQIFANESFDASIESDLAETRDVKIFSYNGDVQHVVSQIYWENAWKNGRYYLKEAYPHERTFKIKVVSFIGSTQLCVQLRKLNGTSYAEHTCVPIEIKVGGSMHESPPDPRDEDENDSQQSTIEPTESFQPLSGPTEIQTTSKTHEKIILNGPREAETSSDFISPEEKIRMNIIYVFAALCVLLIVLLSFKIL